MTVSKWLVIAFIVGVAFTVIADLALKLTTRPEAELWGGELVGYWAAFGFLWYFIIVGFSKLLGSYWLERDEDYYSQEDEVSDE